MAVLAHSEIRAMIHACVQAKNLNIAQEVWDAPVLPDNDSRCVTDDRAWEESIRDLMDWPRHHTYFPFNGPSWDRPRYLPARRA